MSVSDVHKTAVEAAARHYSDCNKKVQGLQRMAPQIPVSYTHLTLPTNREV